MLVTQLCLTLCDPTDCSPPVSLSMEFSRKEYWSGLPFPSPGESSQPRGRTQVSCIADRYFTRMGEEEEIIILIIDISFRNSKLVNNLVLEIVKLVNNFKKKHYNCLEALNFGMIC